MAQGLRTGGTREYKEMHAVGVHRGGGRAIASSTVGENGSGIEVISGWLIRSAHLVRRHGILRLSCRYNTV